MRQIIKKEISCASFEYDVIDKILEIHLKGNIGEREAIAVVREAQVITNKELHANLINGSGMFQISKGARSYFAAVDSKSLAAVALFSNTNFHQIVGNFYLRLSRPIRPTQMFHEKKEARLWLKECISMADAVLREIA